MFRDRIQDCKFAQVLIKNLTFQRKVIKFWNQFTKNSLGEVERQQIEYLFALIFKCLFVFPDQQYKELAREFVDYSSGEPGNEWINYEHFSTAVTQLVYLIIESPDLQSSVHLLKLLFVRVFRHSNYYIEVEFFGADNIEYTLRPDQRFKKSFHPIYFEERFVFQDVQNQYHYELRQLEEIIPIGFSAESVVYILQNNEFNVVPFRHLYSSQYKHAQDIELRAITPPAFLNALPNAQMVPDIGLYPVLFVNNQYYRRNKLLIREIQWSHQLAQNSKNEKFLVNVKSEFFTEEDYGVDQIQKLHKRWERKAIQAKRQLLTAQVSQIDLTQGKSSNPDKRKPKNYKHLARTLFGELNIPKDKEKLAEATKQIEEINLNLNLPAFSHYISKFASQSGRLPQDSPNPYEDDILEYASQSPLQILLIGKPRTGNTTFAQEIAKSLDIEYINLQRGINKIFVKVTENESSPAVDEEGNPKEFLTPLERDVYDSLRFGREVSHDKLEQLLNFELQLDVVKNKGYILNIPLEYWAESILRLKLPKLGCRYFSHVIILDQSDEDVKKFARGIMEKIDENITRTSQYQRDEQRRPKVKVVDPYDEEGEDEPQDDEEKPPIVDEKDLFYCPQDFEELDASLQLFATKQQQLQMLYQHLPEQNIIHIQSAGLNVIQLSETVTSRILMGRPLRPLAIKLEGSGEKDLLTVNLTEEKLARMWSLWAQIDPVELLLKDKVVNGKAEFAADYAGRVFMFDNEENLNKFLAYPRQYLQKSPKLPKTYIVAVQGIKQTGKNTVAKQLADVYGWQLVDVEDIVKYKVANQSQYTKHVPSTFDPRINDIHLTEPEWKEFNKGNPIKDVLPMVLSYLGQKLQKKPPGWGEPKKEDEDQPKDDEEEEKKKKEAKKIPPKKKKEEVVEEVEPLAKPATPPPEDVPTKEIIPLLDAELKVLDKPKGIVLCGYPSTQEQIDQLNLFGIKIDKIILLTDKSEEPFQILLQRVPDYNMELETAFQTQLQTVLKEAYGEDNVKEIGIEGTKEDVLVRVRTALDPFYIRVDDESLVRVPGDVQEGEDPIQFGDYGIYCPITLRDSNWLIPGKEEFIALVRGRQYRFYTEKDMQIFKDNVLKYMGKVSAPPPRIFLSGVRGSGLRTQLDILNKQHKLPVLNLKDNLLANLDTHKKNRQQERYFMKGFKNKELDENGKEVLDPEIMEDPAEFERKDHELKVLIQILQSDGLFINGNFYDVGEEIVSTPIVDLLVEAKRLPEFVILIKIDQDNFIKRNFDSTIIEQEFNTKMEELKMKRKQERIDARQKAIDDNVPEEELPSLDPPAEEAEDPEAPRLEEMLKEGRDKLIAQYEADIAKIEDLARQFEELKIPFTLISSDTTVDNVTIRINNVLEPIMDRDNRQDMLEKYQVQKLNPFPDPENYALNRLKLLEKSYTHKQSRFGDRNPITLSNTPQQRDFPILYRNRIYYLVDEEQRQLVSDRPKLLNSQSVPTDVIIKPSIFVIGKVRSGKTYVSKLLSDKLKLVHIKISKLLEEFIVTHTDQLAHKIKKALQAGEGIDDDSVIEILHKRVQLKDCYENGWILDGYPNTIDQAIKLAHHGLIPTVTFVCLRDEIDILNHKSDKFGGIHEVRLQRLLNAQTEILSYWYQHTFNNVRYLHKSSQWGLFHLCQTFIHEQLISRAHVARALITREPVRVDKLTLSLEQILEKLNPVGNYCPVLMKAKKQYQARPLRWPNLLYFDDQLFVLSSDDCQQDFIKNPNYYQIQQKPQIPRQLIIGDKIDSFEYKGYCPVELINNKLILGQSHLVLEYRGKQICFATVSNLLAYELNPNQFKHARLPDKLPVSDPKEQKNIAKKVAKRGDCTSYLELNLRNIVIRVLAQLGYQRIKYPTLSCKETVLKFIAISLKANNNNKDHHYREKYQKKLSEFLQHCSYPQEIKRLSQVEDEVDEENFLQTVEKFDEFLKELQSKPKEEYFQRFIR